MISALIFALLAAANPVGNVTIESFDQAKTHLRAIYAEHRETLYSGCEFDPDKTVRYSHCDYVPRHTTSRSGHIEWEHVVPAEAFGQGFAEWRVGHISCMHRNGKSYKGRRCAAKTNDQYRFMEADMYNLYPEIGEINGLRSNYGMAEIAGDSGTLYALATKVADRKFEPRPEAKGDVARTYLYMDATYPGRGIISAKNRKLFDAWNRMDPVDAWECRRARRIAQIQGNENAFVARPCEEAGL